MVVMGTIFEDGEDGPKNWWKVAIWTQKMLPKYSLFPGNFFATKGPKKLVKIQQIVHIWFADPASDSGITPSKILIRKWPFTCAIACSTCIQSLAIFCVFKTSAAAKHFWPLKGGMFNSVPDETSISWISKPQSAMIDLPGWRVDRRSRNPITKQVVSHCYSQCKVH